MVFLSSRRDWLASAMANIFSESFFNLSFLLKSDMELLEVDFVGGLVCCWEKCVKNVETD